MSPPVEILGRATHDAVKPISWIIGKWKSVQAEGSYPTIPTFQYGEEIEFCSLGQPLLNYASYSWHPEKQSPMHMENGFLKINPGSNKLAFMVAHNFGLSTVEEGEVSENEIRLISNGITRMSFAKDPSVTKTQRSFRLDGDKLEQLVDMETSTTPMTRHLKVIYSKVL